MKSREWECRKCSNRLINKRLSREWECSKCSNGLINRRLVRGSVIKGKWSNRECNNKGEWSNTNAEYRIQNMEQGIK